MQQWIVRVRDKNKAKSLSRYGNIVFVSKFINVIGIEMSEIRAQEIMMIPNVISVRPSEKGHYQYQ